MVLTWKERKAWESVGAGGQEWCAEKQQYTKSCDLAHLQEKGKMLTKGNKESLFPAARSWTMALAFTDSMDMNLSKLQEMVKDRGAWRAAVHRVTKSWTSLSNWRTTTGFQRDDKPRWLGAQDLCFLCRFTHLRNRGCPSPGEKTNQERPEKTSCWFRRWGKEGPVGFWLLLPHSGLGFPSALYKTLGACLPCSLTWKTPLWGRSDSFSDLKVQHLLSFLSRSTVWGVASTRTADWKCQLTWERAPQVRLVLRCRVELGFHSPSSLSSSRCPTFSCGCEQFFHFILQTCEATHSPTPPTHTSGRAMSTSGLHPHLGDLFRHSFLWNSIRVTSCSKGLWTTGIVCTGSGRRL